MNEENITVKLKLTKSQYHYICNEACQKDMTEGAVVRKALEYYKVIQTELQKGSIILTKKSNGLYYKIDFN